MVVDVAQFPIGLAIAVLTLRSACRTAVREGPSHWFVQRGESRPALRTDPDRHLDGTSSAVHGAH